MNRQECQRLVDAYVEWLRHGLRAESIGEACELTTPFLDRHNDHIQVYAERRNGTIVLSDDGYMLADLAAGGLALETPKRKTALQSVLNGFGVREREGRLEVEATPANLGQRLHSLMQATLAVGDLHVMAQAHTATFFFEDVRAFLDQHEIRYNERVKLAGRSGFDHTVDFLIPKSHTRPERILEAVATPRRANIEGYLFALNDTREARSDPAKPAAEAYAFLNDQEQPIAPEVSEALRAYQVTPIPWAHRDQFTQALAG